TRAPREGEVDGVDYYFVSKEEFEEGIKAGHFLEYATVHGNYYGTSILPVQKALDEEKLVIFDIDIQGHRLVQAKLGDMVTSIFITPPTLKELEKRLYGRSTEQDDVIVKRLKGATQEIRAIAEYDFLIVNDDIERATQEFIIVANSARHKHCKEDLESFISRWLGNE
ncbi:MAG: guanylate kinase, partial [Campylobacterales bacterium]|nr:guanylate kinase [Campylobacterales bacterium]